MSDSSPGRAFLTGSRPYVAAVIAFIGYCLWIGWPYVTSVVIRDAAVTSWSNVVTSPIRGKIRFEPLSIGGTVGEDGLIATIRNDHISTHALEDAKLQVQLATAQLNDAQALMDEIKQLDEGRRELKAQYADHFRAQLDTTSWHYEGEIALAEKRLATIRKISGRRVDLADRGAGSIDAADEAQLREAELELDLIDMRAMLRDAQERRKAADHGVFIDADGGDPDWVRGDRMDLKVAKKEARFALRTAQAKLEAAKLWRDKARTDFDRLSAASITAPPGRLLWRKLVATDMTVEAGEQVAEWLDCDQLLIDMPVSDAEAALIRPGQPAEVVLEGDATARAAEVVLVRGAAATLGRSELAALAKGRREDQAQVLLRLFATAVDFPTCPVGRGAYVDFPGIGVIDIIRSRLRL